jgi:quinoprotein glucose dehydrogenase
MKKTFAAGCIIVALSCNTSHDRYNAWEDYGGSADMIRYSSLQQIDTTNVNHLQVAWTYHTGDADTTHHSQIQCNPIIVNGILYGTSPQLKLIALDAATGKEKWVFNPKDTSKNKSLLDFILNNNRGVTYWTDGQNDKRILYTVGSHLYAIDANTGLPVRSFGKEGTIDLHDGLGRDVSKLFITATSPGIIYKDLYILGSRVEEGAAAAPGHIRAFDVRTGQQRWIFHTIPHPGEPGYETWDDSIAYKHIGGANSWSGLTLDEQRGIVFAPTGSASPDFYGGTRKGQNLYANCLLALDAATGKRRWHFQFIHHDVWDWDLPTAPALVRVKKDGRTIDAVAQPTKHGMVYVFERETGRPLYPIKELPVDTNTTLPGEKLFPTQPISTFSKPFVRQTFTPDDINPYLPDTSIAAIKKQLKEYRYGRMFIPPGKQTSVVFPGYDGGAEWGGPSYDPTTGVLYINANEMGWLLTIKENKPAASTKETYMQAGKRLYEQYCTSCHGADRKGSGNYPALLGVNTRYAASDILQLINTGRRMMPAFKHLQDEERKAITSFIMDIKEQQRSLFVPSASGPAETDSFRNVRFSNTGWYKFVSPEGYPAIKPPWGTITAIDLNSGAHIWTTPLGEYADLKAKGVPPTGTENYGGPVVTAGGLLFIAAARDGKIRAFHKRTGKLLWEYALPAPGFATPAVYSVNNKQYIVIACGGGKLGTMSGDAYVAFALPE